MVNSFAYRVVFTVIPSKPGYQPIKISVKLEDYMAKILMATPVKGVSIAVQRAGGIVMDETPEPLDFLTGGKK